MVDLDVAQWLVSPGGENMSSNWSVTVALVKSATVGTVTGSSEYRVWSGVQGGSVARAA